jgi:hypothetical protein
VEEDQVAEFITWAEAAAVDDNGAAHARMTDTRDFFRFMAAEMPKLVERWHATRHP